MQTANLSVLRLTKRTEDLCQGVPGVRGTPLQAPPLSSLRHSDPSPPPAVHTRFLGELDVARELARVGEDDVVGQIDPDGGRGRAPAPQNHPIGQRSRCYA